jgi:hypothetical protein
MATVDLTNIVFQYPSEQYVLDGTKHTRELGTTTTAGNRRMLGEYANWWESVSNHLPRRYEREDKVLAAMSMTAVQDG